MKAIADMVQVNIPFTMLSESYADRFIAYRLNPEIGLDAEALDTYTFSHMQKMAERLRGAGLSITFHAPFMDLSPGSPDSKIRELTRNRLRQVVRLIPVFRPGTVVCHTGYDHRRYHHIRDLWLENSIDMWSQIAGEAKSEGAALMLENVYEQSPDQMTDLLENLVDRGVGFCLDSGHQAVFSKAPLATWITSLGPFLGQLHLHDNHGNLDDHLGLGRGCIDFRRLLELVMASSPVRPVITLEPHKEEELWPSLEYLETIWPW